MVLQRVLQETQETFKLTAIQVNEFENLIFKRYVVEDKQVSNQPLVRIGFFKNLTFWK